MSCFESMTKCFQPPNEMLERHWSAYESKMKVRGPHEPCRTHFTCIFISCVLNCWQAEGLNPSAIKAFEYNFEKLTSGTSLVIPESTIEPVSELPDYESLSGEKVALLKETGSRCRRVACQGARCRPRLPRVSPLEAAMLPLRVCRSDAEAERRARDRHGAREGQVAPRAQGREHLP